jgi:hypothetical protein
MARMVVAFATVGWSSAWCEADDVASGSTSDSTSKMPFSAQQQITHEQQEEAQAKALYDGQVAKLHAELIKKLKLCQASATKAGDLDGALAIKAEIASLAPPAVAEVPSSPVGTYNVSDSDWNVTTIELHDSGHTVDASDGSTGTWTLRDDRLIITWYNGNTNTALFTGQAMRMIGVGGGTFTLTRR